MAETLLYVKVVPGSSKNEIAGQQGDRLRIKIAAAPEDGKANAALTAFLAEQYKVPKRNVEIVAGEKSRLKTIKIIAHE
jgi:uncharacterized protein (TIGR00251 family)